MKNNLFLFLSMGIVAVPDCKDFLQVLIEHDTIMFTYYYVAFVICLFVVMVKENIDNVIFGYVYFCLGSIFVIFFICKGIGIVLKWFVEIQITILTRYVNFLKSLLSEE